MTHNANRNAILRVVIVGLVLGGSSWALADSPLRGYWAFDEGSGTTVYDSSICQSDGTISSVSMWNSPGHDGIGSALCFDGYQSSTSVNIPHDSCMDFDGNLYLSAWIKHETDPGGHTIDPVFCKGTSSSAYALYVDARGLQFVGNDQQPTEFRVYTDPNLITDGVWTHVAAHYDQNTVRLYVNNALAAEVPVSTPITNNSEPLYLGIDPPGFTERFTGCIDNVIVASVAEGLCAVGDLNCDGLVNNGDIDPFVLALTNPVGYFSEYPYCDITRADCNGDGFVNYGDIDPFVALLTAAWIYNPVTTHSYRLTSPGLSWVEAEAEAVAACGHLVTINDAAEQDWLCAQFPRDESQGDPPLWIGLYQEEGAAEPDGGWVWTSGEPVTYTNWHSGEPNDGSGSDNERYGVLHYYVGCGWNDLPEGGQFPGIIERSTAP